MDAGNCIHCVTLGQQLKTFADFMAVRVIFHTRMIRLSALHAAEFNRIDAAVQKAEYPSDRRGSQWTMPHSRSECARGWAWFNGTDYFATTQS